MRFEELLEARMPNVLKPEAHAAAVAEGFDPKIWYHGTTRRFNEFRPSKGGGVDELGPGIYVCDQQWLANTWARSKGFVLTCLVRKGPLFDYGTLRSARGIKIAHDAHSAMMDDRFGPGSAYPTKMFTDLLDRRGYGVVNISLPYLGYVGGFKHESQIEGQLVVYKEEDVRIIARERGE